MCCLVYDWNIVAAFRGMHVSPAKHSYRKFDYRRDGQTDAGQSAPYVPLCFAGHTKSVDCDHRVLVQKRKKKKMFPSESKKLSKKSVSIVNPTLILPALSTPNKRKGTPASILNLSFQARSLSKMHAYRHIPAQTRLEITLSGTSYILRV